MHNKLLRYSEIYSLFLKMTVTYHSVPYRMLKMCFTDLFQVKIQKEFSLLKNSGGSNPPTETVGASNSRNCKHPCSNCGHLLKVAASFQGLCKKSTLFKVFVIDATCICTWNTYFPFNIKHCIALIFLLWRNTRIFQMENEIIWSPR